jgi:hypothetical protein
MGLFDYLSDKINGTSNQLHNEKNKVVLEGNEDAISALKKMDTQIGKLMKPFNGVARVPSEVVSQVEDLIKQNAQAITLVKGTKAYEESRLERLGNTLRNDDGTNSVPVKYLEYENVFKSNSGARVEQRVAQVRLGQ